MRRDRPHTHACQQCGKPAECHGELEPNHDGFPIVTCRAFHLDGGQIDTDFACEACEELRDRCDEPSDPDGEAFRGGEAAAYEREQMIAAQKLK